MAAEQALDRRVERRVGHEEEERKKKKKTRGSLTLHFSSFAFRRTPLPGMRSRHFPLSCFNDASGGLTGSCMGGTRIRPAEHDELVAGAERAGLVADGVDDHLLAALDADEQAGAAIVAVSDEQLAELDEGEADQLLGGRHQEHLVVVAADGEQLPVELRHPVEQGRPRQQSQAQGVGGDDFVGAGLEQVEPVGWGCGIRRRCSADDTALADLSDRDADQDGLAVGVLALAVVGEDDDRVGLGDLGPAEDDLAGRVPLDDVDVAEGGLVGLVGQVDLVGLVVDDDDRTLLGDDLGVDLPDPLQPARAPSCRAPGGLPSRSGTRRSSAGSVRPAAEYTLAVNKLASPTPVTSRTIAVIRPITVCGVYASSRPLNNRAQTLQSDSTKLEYPRGPSPLGQVERQGSEQPGQDHALDHPADLVAVPARHHRHQAMPPVPLPAVSLGRRPGRARPSSRSRHRA